MELIQQIKQDGAQKDMCRLFQMRLKPDLTIKDLAELYFRGMDFCISKDFPTVEFMRDNFKGKSEQYGVFVDDLDVDVRNERNVALLGDCNAQMIYDGFSVSRVYVRHNSQAKITVLGYANLSVDVFDNAQVAIAVAGTKAKVLVNVYGNAKVVSTGSVKITHKQNY